MESPQSPRYNKNRRSSGAVDISIAYHRPTILPSREALTSDPNELEEQLNVLRQTERALNSPPYHEAFWKYITKKLSVVAADLGFAPSESEYEIRTMEDIYKTMVLYSDCCALFVPVNAHTIARGCGLPVETVLTELLYATSAGLMEMVWSIECERCGGGASMEMSLFDIQHNTVCALCRAQNHATYFDQVKVHFSWNPSILYYPASYMDCPKSPTCPRMAHFQNVWFYVSPTTNNTKWSYLFGMDHPKSQPALAQGRYWFHCPYSKVDCYIDIQRDALENDVPLRQLLQISDMTTTTTTPGSSQPKRKVFALEHGKIRLDFCAAPNSISLIWVYKDIPEDEQVMFYMDPKERQSSPTASECLHLPCFGPLFGHQVVSKGTRFTIRKVYLVFTDIVSSTNLYEDSGDGNALVAVQQHFQVLFGCFGRRGRIVKTIGDAVMGAFSSGEEAICAVADALDMLITEGHERPDGSPLQIRVGIHAGSALVVPLNGINDYFGGTVNVAARVESKAVGGECLVSEGVLADPAANAAFETLLANGYHPTRDVELELKGVVKPVRVRGFRSKHAVINGSHN